MAGVIEPGELDWTALRGAVIAQGEVIQCHLARRHVPDVAAAAAKVGLRVEVTGPEQIRLTLLVRERAPPEIHNLCISKLETSPVVVRVESPAEAVYRNAVAFAWQSAAAITREARGIYEEQLQAFDNTGE